MRHTMTGSRRLYARLPPLRLTEIQRPSLEGTTPNSAVTMQGTTLRETS